MAGKHKGWYQSAAKWIVDTKNWYQVSAKHIGKNRDWYSIAANWIGNVIQGMIKSKCDRPRENQPSLHLVTIVKIPILKILIGVTSFCSC